MTQNQRELLGLKECKYVKLEDVLFVLNALHSRSNTTARFAYSNAYNYMINLDGEDVTRVKHGHWDFYSRCSVCAVRAIDDFESDFCPNCGARMDEVINNAE